jgi:exonuclease VII large subunit
MPIPVILATGHTVDTSLLDELVWHAAKTPSDAAHLIVDGMEQTAARVADLYVRITQTVQNRTDRLGDEIASLRSGVRLLGRRQIERIVLRVEQMRTGVQSHDPVLQTHRGFAIVRDRAEQLLTKETVKTLVSGDQLSIEVFGEKFYVEKM